MRMKTVRILAMSILLVSHGLAWGDYDDGLAAANRGDYDTALHEWRPLAEEGDSAAQYNLGVMYDTGQGVPQDYTEAVKWYRKAALQGDSGSQVNLGVMYLLGHGVLQDYVQAHMWFNIAGANGDATGINNRDIVAEKMTPDQIAEAQKLAREWMDKHP
jgi:TPR repeat protein